jgi:hypothetical protein
MFRIPANFSSSFAGPNASHHFNTIDARDASALIPISEVTIALSRFRPFSVRDILIRKSLLSRGGDHIKVQLPSNPLRSLRFSSVRLPVVLIQPVDLPRVQDQIPTFTSLESALPSSGDARQQQDDLH